MEKVTGVTWDHSPLVKSCQHCQNMFKITVINGSSPLCSFDVGQENENSSLFLSLSPHETLTELFSFSYSYLQVYSLV